MKELSQDELKKTELEILKYLDFICEKNNIRYYIFFGTLIGAIRHKGFIPWDDDIDVCMPREDYDKFVEIMKNDSNYYFISPETDNLYYWPFARLCDKKTILILNNLKKVKNFGVFVDVFPMDNAPLDEEKNEWLKQYIYYEKRMKNTIPREVKYSKLNFVGLLKAIKHLPLRIKYKPSKFNYYRDSLLAIIKKYNSYERDKYIISSTPYKTKTIFSKDNFKETIKVKFESLMVNAPKDYDILLKKIYGDYMQLPSIDKQKSHHNFVAYWLENK